MKNLNKPFVKNTRLDAPLGLLGVPPDAPFGANNVLLIATLTDSQLDALMDIINRQDHPIRH